MTHDAGQTWSAPAVITDPGPNRVTAGSMILADRRNGTLYHLTNNVGFTPPPHHPDRGKIFASASHDGGATWSTPVAVAEDSNAFFNTDPNTGQVLLDAGGAFDAAIDPHTGALYLVFQGGDFTTPTMTRWSWSAPRTAARRGAGLSG